MLALPSEECFSHLVQDFLICTTVHKARQLGVFQGETLVRITLDKCRRQTKSYPNSENPYFNEYFVFEIKSTITELLRLTILYEVKKKTTCKKNPTLGELLVDMQSVWNQPNRCYFKRWGRLEVPIGQQNMDDTNCGYLQIDLAIVSQAVNPQTAAIKPLEEQLIPAKKWQINQDFDNIEQNLLQKFDSNIRCNILYTVMFYRGIMARKADYIIQFRFHPFKGKTKAAKSTESPVWNQQITFAWIYPSLSQTFLIQLLSHDHLQWKCIAEYEMHFDEIAFKDTPSVGPTYIHLYDNLNGTNYIGRLLIAIKSHCLNANPNRELRISGAAQLDEKRFWSDEFFILEFIAMQGDFMHSNVSNCKISMRLAEYHSNYVECYLKNYRYKKEPNAANTLKFFRNEYPYKAITLKILLPDNRSKYESDYFLHELLDIMKTEMDAFKMFQVQYTFQYQSQLKVLRSVINTFIDKITEAVANKRLQHTGHREPTQWDKNRLLHLQEYFQKLEETLRNLRHRLKPSKHTLINLVIEEVLHELNARVYEMQNLLNIIRVQDEWPDLILLINCGMKEIGYCRLNAKNFLHPPKDRQLSTYSQCWKVRSFVFKDIQCRHTCSNCGCIVGIIQGCMSITAERDRNEYMATIAQEWKHPEAFYWSPNVEQTALICRIFIHQAKVRPGSDRTGLCDPFIRVMICLQSADTPVLYATLSPIWNAVIVFDKVILPGSLSWYEKYPPLLAMELYDTDKNTADDYLGCGCLPVSIISNDLFDNNANDEIGLLNYSRQTPFFRNEKYRHAIQRFQSLKMLSPPPLKWVPIAVCGTTRAEVLISAELIEIIEVDDEVLQTDVTVAVGIPTPIRPIMRNFVLEVVFAGFRNYQKICTSSSTRHRVKVMMADLQLTSGLSASRIKQSINFLILYASGVVSLPDQVEYWPAIIATDVCVSARGIETTAGAVLISNCKQYLQNNHQMKCIADSEPETSLGSTTVPIEYDENAEDTPLINNKNQKPSLWQRFCKIMLRKQYQKNALQHHNLENVLEEKEYTWWTKFYNSTVTGGCSSSTLFKHHLCIYQNELEKQREFSYLIDWAEPLGMVHGVKYKKNALPKEEVYATLKLNIKITPCASQLLEAGDAASMKPMPITQNPRYQAQLQSLADLVKVTVRVYIVQGIQFRPSEKNPQADSYVKIQLGQKHLTNRAHFVPNESNPIFGKCFQLDGLIPREHILEVSVFNRNNVRDDIIGSTYIDIEDRWRSRHYAKVGIADEYCRSGYNQWRDSVLPSEILNELCYKNDIRLPKCTEDTIEIDGFILEDETRIAVNEDMKERLSLTALKNLEKLPSFGYKLVPEHVETRSLYRNDCPGIVQGKIQLWVELYDANMNIPDSIDITPQPPLIYELRVIIYQCADVIFNDRNIFGNLMSDIYVKGWCTNPDEPQSTDVHYRSLNGEGKFNWRMIFPIKYSNIEDMVVIKRKSGLLEEYEIKQPPILCLQIFDNDLISEDDFLGSLEIHLSNFPEPYSTAKQCKLSDDEFISKFTVQSKSETKDQRKPMNLFRQRKVRGWFPMKGHSVASQLATSTSTTSILTGKIEIEIEMLTETEASNYPAGLAREPPQPLPLPDRPDTSFNPFLHPVKSLRKIIFPKLRKYVIFMAILVLAGFLLFLLFIRIE